MIRWLQTLTRGPATSDFADDLVLSKLSGLQTLTRDLAFSTQAELIEVIARGTLQTLKRDTASRNLEALLAIATQVLHASNAQRCYRLFLPRPSSRADWTASFVLQTLKHDGLLKNSAYALFKVIQILASNAHTRYCLF